MPRSTRERLIRFYDQSQNDLNRTLENLRKMIDTYGDDYLNHKTMLEQIAGMVINLQGILENFRNEMM